MLSFFFKSHSMAQNIVLLINVTAVTLMLATFIMEFIPSTKTASAICKKIFMLMPGYALGEGLLNLAIRVRLGGVTATMVCAVHHMTHVCACGVCVCGVCVYHVVRCTRYRWT